jgi:hypothetical protein
MLTHCMETFPELIRMRLYCPRCRAHSTFMRIEQRWICVGDVQTQREGCGTLLQYRSSSRAFNPEVHAARPSQAIRADVDIAGLTGDASQMQR